MSPRDPFDPFEHPYDVDDDERRVAQSALPPPSRRRGGATRITTDAELAAWPGCTCAGKEKKEPVGSNVFAHQRTPGGKISFRMRYKLRLEGGGESLKDFTIGDFPETSIELALKTAEFVRELGRQGINAVAYRDMKLKEADLGPKSTFGTNADVWYLAMQESELWSKPKYMKEVRAHLDNWIKPHPIWNMPLRRVTIADAVTVLEKCSSTSTQKKLISYIRRIALEATARGRIRFSPLTELEPTLGIQGQRKRQKTGKVHQPAVVNLPRLGVILRMSEASNATWQVKLAHRFLAYIGQRIGVAVPARWADIDLERGLWTLKREEQKNSDQGGGGDDREYRAFHDVPLAPQVVRMLRKIPRNSEWVFPKAKDLSACISSESVEQHLHALGLKGEHVPHGWRSSLVTWANGQVDSAGRRIFERWDIELAVDHKLPSAIMAAYNREIAIAVQRPIFEAWANALEAAELKAGVLAMAPD